MSTLFTNQRFAITLLAAGLVVTLGLFLAVGRSTGRAAPAQPEPIELTSQDSTVVGGAAAPGDRKFTLARVGARAAWNSCPIAEQGAQAVDGDLYTKYLNHAKTEAGVIITPAGTPRGSRVTRIQLGTANDFPARDPVTFTLEGTDDVSATTTLDSTWTLIASGSTGMDKDPGRLVWVTPINFPNDKFFRSYRVLFQSTRDPHTNCMQIADITLFGFLPDAAP